MPQAVTAAPRPGVSGWEWMLLAGVFGLAVFTRLHDLGAESCWLDEATTWVRGNLPVPLLIANSIKKMHVPTYFLLVHAVLPFGDDEWMLRLPSAVLGMLKPVLVAVAGYAVAGPRAAITAALLLVLCPLHLRYDQEARMYALQTFGVCCSLAGQLWVYTHLREAVHCVGRRVEGRVGRARLAWAAHIVGTAIALYAHNTSGLFVLASSAAALVFMLTERELRTRFFCYWVVANALVVLLWAPWLPTLWFQLRTPRLAHREWGSVPGWRSAGRLTASLMLLGESKLMNATVCVLGLLGAWHLRSRRALLLALLLLSFSAPGLVWLVSLKKPMMLPRMVLWGGPAFYVLVGCGVAQLRRPLLQAVALVAILVVGLWQLQRGYYQAQVKTDWRGVALLASQFTQPGAYVVPNTYGEARPLGYYAHRRTNPITIPGLDQAPEADRIRRLQVFLEARKPREILLVHITRGDPPPPAALKVLAQYGHMVRQYDFNEVRVVHFTSR